MERLFDLAQKDVVCIESGTVLGRVSDVDIDIQTGKISALIIPGRIRALGLLGREAERVIPWEMIKKVGADTILVKIPAENQ